MKTPKKSPAARCLESLINGNIAQAKKQAQRIPFEELRRACAESGANPSHALYLKGKIDWERHCANCAGK